MQPNTTSDPLSADRASLDLIAEFAAQADVTGATRHKYRVHLQELLVWLNHPSSGVARGRRMQLLDARPGDIKRFMAYLQTAHRFAGPAHHRVKGDLSASARKNFLSSVRSFFRYLVSVELLDVDPSASVRPPRVVVRPGLRLGADELRALLDAQGSPRERIQTYLLAYTAARAGEIRSLKWPDVDLVERTITLRGKGEKYRVVDIHPVLAAELRRWHIEQTLQAERNPALRLAAADPSRNYVLLTKTGKALSNTAIARQLKLRAARAGLHTHQGGCRYNKSRISPHALRRSFATLLLNDGHHIDAVADVLGHASVDTTRKHYAFSSNARRRSTIEGFHV